MRPAPKFWASKLPERLQPEFWGEVALTMEYPCATDGDGEQNYLRVLARHPEVRDYRDKEPCRCSGANYHLPVCGGTC